MTVHSAAIFYVLFVTVIVNQVTAWTIDLPEVRKYFFEKYEDPYSEKDDPNKSGEDRNGRNYDNIRGDSLHNSRDQYNYYNLQRNRGVDEDQNSNIYANSYRNYESYMVRKVQTALHNGTAYLEGLRLSIERYIVLLENCSRLNSSTSFDTSSPLSIGEFSGIRDWTETCREATKASEHVKRLADLALYTTRRLQDVAFTAKYNKDDSMEENELLLRLAWYLDKLAHLTGYDPDPHAHTTTTKPSEPAPAQSRLPFPDVTEEMKRAILNCLRANSSEPATERCAFRVPQPVLRQLAKMHNISESAFRLDVPLPGRVSRRSSDDTSQTSLEPELLLATDNKRVFPPISPVKTVRRKRSVTDSTNPLVKVLKYYAKHKVWINSNPLTENSENSTPKFESMDVENSLHSKSIQKRSIEFKTKINKILEDPMQDISKYVKSKPNLHYNIDKEEANRIKAALDTLHSKKVLSKNKIKKLKKIFRYKRSHPLEHVSESIKTNTDIHYDIHNDVSDKLKAVVHHLHGHAGHLHGHAGHLDGHAGHFHEPIHHHIPPLHGPIEHTNIKTDFHYENVHKEEPVEKIKAALHHLHEKKVILQKKFETLRKILRPKRFAHFEGVIKPRVPMDPQGDISYYTRNKPGTDKKIDFTQAALLRLALEKVFQRGNINVVHRYGANYNPAVVNPFYAGVVRTVADV